jgi:hypothetical protein
MRSIVVNVTCRCGQGFNTQADRYPHRIGCHVCGRHFNVWSDGSIIDLGENTSRATAFESAAIQAEPVLSLSTAPSSTSFALGLPDDANPAAATKLQADLRLIDLQWQSDRKLHTLIPVIGIMIMPSKMLSVSS